jgi:KUP system potassium uptake protein
VRFEQVPRVTESERVVVEPVAEGLWHVTVRFGFVEVPNLSQALTAAREHGCPIDLDHAIYLGGRDEVVRSRTDRLLPGWRRILFGFLYRNAVHNVDRFALPRERFIEIGRQLEL